MISSASYTIENTTVFFYKKNTHTRGNLYAIQIFNLNFIRPLPHTYTALARYCTNFIN